MDHRIEYVSTDEGLTSTDEDHQVKSSSSTQQQQLQQPQQTQSSNNNGSSNTRSAQQQQLVVNNQAATTTIVVDASSPSVDHSEEGYASEDKSVNGNSGQSVPSSSTTTTSSGNNQQQQAFSSFKRGSGRLSMFNNNIERWMEAADRSLAKSQQQSSSSSPDGDGQSTSDVVDGVNHDHDHNTQLNHSPSLSSSPSSGFDCDTTPNAPNKTSSTTTRTSVLINTASKRVTRTMINQDVELIIGHGDVDDDEPMINKSTVMKRLTIKDEKDADAILNDADDDDDDEEEEEDADDDDNEIVKGLRNHHKVTYVRDVNPVKSGNGSVHSTKSSSTSKLLASSKLSPFTSCMKKSNSTSTSSAAKDASKQKMMTKDEKDGQQQHKSSFFKTSLVINGNSNKDNNKINGHHRSDSSHDSDNSLEPMYPAFVRSVLQVTPKKSNLISSSSLQSPSVVGGGNNLTSTPSTTSKNSVQTSNANVSNSDNAVTTIIIKAGKGPLGIHVVPFNDPQEDESENGLLIEVIEPGGRIDRDGQIKPNDRIIEINGHSLLNVDFVSAQNIFKSVLKDEQEILLKIIRNNDVQTINNDGNNDKSSNVIKSNGTSIINNHHLHIQQNSFSSIKSQSSEASSGQQQQLINNTSRLINNKVTNSPPNIFPKPLISSSPNNKTNSTTPGRPFNQKQLINETIISNNEEEEDEVSKAPKERKMMTPKDVDTPKTVSVMSTLSSKKIYPSRSNKDKKSNLRTATANKLLGHASNKLGHVSSNTRKIGKQYNITLIKSSQGLGFSITTRDNPAGGNCPIYIKNILPKGPAVSDKRLKQGDRLLQVNGIQMTGKSQEEAVELLKRIPVGSAVDLIVSRQESIVDPLLCPSPKAPRPIPPEKVDVIGIQLPPSPGECHETSTMLLGGASGSSSATPAAGLSAGINTDDGSSPLPPYSSSINPGTPSNRPSSAAAGGSKDGEIFIIGDRNRSSMKSIGGGRSGGSGRFVHHHHQEVEIDRLEIPLNDTGSAGLGVNIMGKRSGARKNLSKDIENAASSQTTEEEKQVKDLGLFVKSVFHGGAAHKDGRLRPHDQLISINDKPLLGLNNSEAMETLAKTMLEYKPVTSGSDKDIEPSIHVKKGVITLVVARRVPCYGGPECTNNAITTCTTSVPNEENNEREITSFKTPTKEENNETLIGAVGGRHIDEDDVHDNSDNSDSDEVFKSKSVASLTKQFQEMNVDEPPIFPGPLLGAVGGREDDVNVDQQFRPRCKSVTSVMPAAKEEEPELISFAVRSRQGASAVTTQDVRPRSKSVAAVTRPKEVQELLVDGPRFVPARRIGPNGQFVHGSPDNDCCCFQQKVVHVPQNGPSTTPLSTYHMLQQQQYQQQQMYHQQQQPLDGDIDNGYAIYNQQQQRQQLFNQRPSGAGISLHSQATVTTATTTTSTATSTDDDLVKLCPNKDGTVGHGKKESKTSLLRKLFRPFGSVKSKTPPPAPPTVQQIIKEIEGEAERIRAKRSAQLEQERIQDHYRRIKGQTQQQTAIVGQQQQLPQRAQTTTVAQMHHQQQQQQLSGIGQTQVVNINSSGQPEVADDKYGHYMNLKQIQELKQEFATRMKLQQQQQQMYQSRPLLPPPHVVQQQQGMMANVARQGQQTSQVHMRSLSQPGMKPKVPRPVSNYYEYEAMNPTAIYEQRFVQHQQLMQQQHSRQSSLHRGHYGHRQQQLNQVNQQQQQLSQQIVNPVVNTMINQPSTTIIRPGMNQIITDANGGHYGVIAGPNGHPMAIPVSSVSTSGFSQPAYGTIDTTPAAMVPNGGQVMNPFHRQLSGNNNRRIVPMSSGPIPIQMMSNQQQVGLSSSALLPNNNSNASLIGGQFKQPQMIQQQQQFLNPQRQQFTNQYQQQPQQQQPVYQSSNVYVYSNSGTNNGVNGNPVVASNQSNHSIGSYV